MPVSAVDYKKQVDSGPVILTDEEIKVLSGKIEALVREEYGQEVYERLVRGPGEALMLAAHHLLGWRGLRDLIR